MTICRASLPAPYTNHNTASNRPRTRERTTDVPLKDKTARAIRLRCRPYSRAAAVPKSTTPSSGVILSRAAGAQRRIFAACVASRDRTKSDKSCRKRPCRKAAMVFPAVRVRVRLLGTLARILRSAQDDKLGRLGLAARRLGTNVAALTCHSERSEESSRASASARHPE